MQTEEEHKPADTTDISVHSATESPSTLPERVKPKHFYFAVSQPKLWRKETETDTNVTSNQVYSVFKKSTAFAVFNDYSEALRYKVNNTRAHTRAFFSHGKYFPVLLKIETTQALVMESDENYSEYCELSTIENIQTACFINNTSVCVLRSLRYEEELKDIVHKSLIAYRGNKPTKKRPSKATCTSTTRGCSTALKVTQYHHGQTGLDRAEKLYDSLAGLNYFEMFKTVSDFMENPLNGHLHKEHSFRAILYKLLMQHYDNANMYAHYTELKEIALVNINSLLAKIFVSTTRNIHLDMNLITPRTPALAG